MTRKLVALALALCLLLSATAALADRQSAGEAARAAADLLPEDQRTLNIFTWTYYIPDEVVAEFEAASGITVNYASMLGNEDVLPKLTQAGAQYDLVVCSNYIIPDLTGQNLLLPIDSSRIENYKNIDPAYQGQYYDPQDQYAIPYTNTAPMIVYNPDEVDFEVKGYADLWREEFKGSLALVAEWRNVIGMAQKKLGYSFNESDPEHMREVGEALLQLKDNIAVMNDDTPHNALISGDAIAGFMYGSQIAAAREVLPQLKVVYPEEGLGFGIDCLVVPAQAPHADAAYIFLNYLLDGEVSAYVSELINYGNCNREASPYFSERYQTDDTVNIPSDLLAAAEIVMPLTDEQQKIYNEVWTKFMQ